MHSQSDGSDENPVLSPHRASMNEVAARAGVSHQTVSRVINNSPNVSVTTRQRVEKVIQELNYRPSNSARALVTRHTKTIGFIAGGVNYYGPISTMGAIESVAREHGFYLSVAILDEREYTPQAFEEVAGSFLDQGVEAFVFLAPTTPMVEAALNANITQPRVILTSSGDLGTASPSVSSSESLSASSPTSQSSPPSASLSTPPSARGHAAKFIGIDQFAAAKSVIDHLADLGHTSCLFFSGPEEWGDATMRLQAWRECSAQRGWEISMVRMSSWDAADAYSSARELFAGMAKEKLPTAIVTSNDLQAFGVCKALYELGIHVPQDVSVVGFDDMPGSDFHIPALTTVRPDFEALGRSAMQELLGMLGIPSDGDTVPMREAAEGNILIPAELVVRETSAAPR